MTLVRVNNSPIPLSNGIKLGSGFMPELYGVSEAGGKFSFPVPHPSFGPSDDSWKWATARSAKPGDGQRFYNQGWHSAPAIGFASLSGLSPWWMKSDTYTHVLRDVSTGRLVGVVEAHNPEGNLLWHELQRAIEEPDSFDRCARDSWRTERGVALANEASPADLFFCLHPCPQGYLETPRMWCFDGTPAIRIQRDHSGTWEPSFLAALAEEESRAWEHA